MPRYIAFLRAINVGGHNVKMEQLRGLFESLGFKDVETFIASGNVIFTDKSKSPALLEKKIEACLHKALGYEVATFLRTDAEVAAALEHKAFKDSQLKTAKSHNVIFLSSVMDAKTHKLLRELETEIDTFHLNERELYWLCKTGQSDSKFSNAVFEKKFRMRGTFRGMNMLAKLSAKYPPIGSRATS